MLRRTPASRATPHAFDEADVVDIPLRSYRFNVRKPRLRADRDVLRVVLPGYFGSRPWDIPRSDVTVVDLLGGVDDRLQPGASEDAVDVWMEIPYLITTGPLTQPTLEFLFRTPQRVPPLRLGGTRPTSDLPVGYFQSRSAEGGWLPGFQVRAVDAPEAVSQLRRLGYDSTDEPLAWIEQHYGATAEPVEPPARRQRRLAKRLATVSMLIGLPAYLALLFLRSSDSWLVVGPAIGGTVLALVLGSLAGRKERRHAVWLERLPKQPDSDVGPPAEMPT